MNTFWQILSEEFKTAFSSVFEKKWPSWVAGILIAVIALLIFLWNVPWGIAGGYRNWGDWILYFIIPGKARPQVTPWLHNLSVTNFGLFAGALASALVSKQFKIRPAPRIEYIKGIAGGILMGAGAALASGCNVGGFYTAVGIFSVGGYAMMIGLGIGAFIGLRLLLWEMEHFPQKTQALKAPSSREKRFNWSAVQQIIGGIIFAAGIAAFYVYSSIGKTQIGGLLFFGFLIGLVMHRSRFCFVRAFREPFMTGDSEMVRAIALSLIIYGCGSAVIKWTYIQPPNMGVFHPFWIGSLAGGLIFGIGMLLAGGCASSTLWRVGEGHTKLMATLITFAVTNSAAKSLLTISGFEGKLGSARFMPDILSWQLAIPVSIFILLVWIIITGWNEKTEKFVIF